ncbi:hypothetical protein CLAFUW4_00463 [Fulvia fulva]|uniref:uncharacterized protein n=1 Tax=Passalora fulva TaxID=5499 RepID=UPI0028526FFF|nr:uncharacterized protein CLAFUR5_20124 [Fulvia fulva]KAK4636065.1 hypothetical protein CLAFUR4_00463 [Fulvia fulva]WMI38750.1 hypothetical protein CLAFUR5_20124 [Fulvia fulva]WPV08849.1 hypothetical protein CLAFUW4_00463 [Fulvia fulva]WPV24481.1 hypothetical protein CLAFUW7_00467 [Fulvia fulva]
MPFLNDPRELLTPIMNEEADAKPAHSPFDEDDHKPSLDTQDQHDEQKETPTKDDLLARHLETIALSFITAINTRNLDPSVAPWSTSMVDHFTTGSGTGARPSATNKIEMLAGHRKLADANPNFQIRITSFTTFVSEKIGTAQVVMNAQSTGVPGVPVGLWRNAVTILDFRMVGRRWFGVRESTISGAGRMDQDWF